METFFDSNSPQTPSNLTALTFLVILRPFTLFSEFTALRNPIRKVFLKILQHLQKNICFRVFFSIKLQVEGLPLYQIEIPVLVFSCGFCDIFKKTHFINVCE